MRVKRLEIQGFKSFKDKTVIHFDHRITGIVGPNGCGKSNIVDAFFWVMGEQSYKHMRGTSSEDLIFNGSSKYAALGVAEATLVMEQDEDAGPPVGASFKDTPPRKTRETSVTRRLYRSGEGEYLINGLPARLRDIHELFMDSGLGTKGYSVIEQGQIAKVVNAKPDERRMLFEEAAGIAKYKARKKESLRKLEATEHNMSRLQDLIREVEGHRKSLEQQSEKARTYERYREALTQKETVWAKRKKAHFDGRVQVLEAERLECQSVYEGARARMQVLENDYEVRKTRKLDGLKKQEDLNQALNLLTEQLSEKRSALELSKARQSDLHDQKKRLLEESVALASQMEKLEEAVEAKTSLLEEVQGALEAVAERLSALLEKESERQSQVGSLREALRSKEDERASLGRLQAQLAQEKALLSGKLEVIQAEFASFEKQHESLSERQEELRALLHEAKMEACSEALETARADCIESLQKKKDAESKLQSCRLELLGKEQSLTLLESKLKALEELDLQHEGLGKGVKTVLEWLKARQGDGRVLIESIEVQEGAEKALEVVLEQRLETLIGASFKEIQDWLEAHPDPERVTFFLSEEARPEKLEKHPAPPGSLGPLRAACQCTDEKISTCLDVLLEGVYWLEDAPLEQLRAARKAHQHSVWVTRSGLVLSPNGLLQVGTRSESVASQVLRRAQAKSNLRENIALLEAEKLFHEETLEASECALQVIQTEWEGFEEAAKQLEFDLLGLKKEVSTTEAEYRTLQLSQNLALKQQSERQEQIDKLRDRLSQLEVEEGKQEALLLILEEALEVYRARSESLEQEHELDRDVTQQCRIQCASLQERVESIKREVEAALKAQAEAQRQDRKVQEALCQFEKDHDGFGAKEEELAEVIESLTLQAAEQREAVASVRDELECLEAEEAKVHQELKQLQTKAESSGDKGHEVVLDLERIHGEWSHIQANMDEKYGAGWSEKVFSEAILETIEEDEAQLTEAVSRLKERMKRLGEVNLGAIAEYEVMKTRHETLLKEKGDLETSVKNLQEAIEHINKTSKERFQKAFEAISSRFERLYPIIFGGGAAKLTLQYPEGSKDILEAGIEIYASPPGKKVSHIGLLSGGEKALTAVCLVFAIFMVKPSPFCVLDEVDAPLDDANVGRFNGLLKEMSSKSQFILITHNKKTMELNDTLYGVTMEEPGVSKMVSIEMQ
jgi:chromosome segregation protein